MTAATRRPAARAERTPLSESSTATVVFGVGRQPAQRHEVGLGVGLGVGDVVAGDDGGEAGQAEVAVEERLDPRPAAGGGDADRHPGVGEFVEEAEVPGRAGTSPAATSDTNSSVLRAWSRGTSSSRSAASTPWSAR